MSPMTTCREVPEKMEDRLIVALDVPSISEARALIDKLEGVVSFFKVGLWLQFAAGFDGLLDYLLAKNKNIFPVLCSKRHVPAAIATGVPSVAEARFAVCGTVSIPERSHQRNWGDLVDISDFARKFS